MIIVQVGTVNFQTTNLKIFRRPLRESTQEVGYDEPAWTTKPASHRVKRIYDVEYPIPSCWRLLKEAGLSYQKKRLEDAKADPEAREPVNEVLNKSAGKWTR